MKEVLTFFFFRINEDPNICGWREIKQILIGNYVRKLNDESFWIRPVEYRLGEVWSIRHSFVYCVVVTVVWKEPSEHWKRGGGSGFGSERIFRLPCGAKCHSGWG